MFDFSLIVPIFNRPEEADELLKSLAEQSRKNFELVLVEDGSTMPSSEIVDKYIGQLSIKYITKSNTGRSDTRNVGMEHASGNYFVFFDSDCIIPSGYFETLEEYLENDYADCFGGPDNAHESFSDIQKAINYAMTSFWTTGGIRGGKINMEKFVPRTFNMGFSREVYAKVGGFKNMFGEDIDLSMRIREAGFSTKLFRSAFVYHKRRVSLKKFYKQVNIFGIARINLYKLYPQSLKLVHALPAAFTLGSLLLLILSLYSPYFLLPFAFFTLLLFFDSLIRNKSAGIALLSVIACYIQLYGYGTGFIKSFVEKIILRKGLEDIETLKRIYK
ncbi:MAG: glycosyltransferase [Prevotellaceae bacterium]|jgi:glycosyltransferase involved in cell wall biosynthesis|nr:glycosyltransferase [Prevotellaceae bacterium]